MKKAILLIWLAMVSCVAFSQSTVVLRFGVAYDYYLGLDNTSFNEFKFESARAIPNLEAMLGLKSISNPQDSSLHIIGLFGRAGFIGKSIIMQNVADQKLDLTVDSTRTYGDFQELEFGLLLFGKLRTTAGYGQMNFYDENHKPVSVNYLCGTVGLCVPLKRFSWNINVTVMKGRDFNTVVYRPSTSLVFTLD